MPQKQKPYPQNFASKINALRMRGIHVQEIQSERGKIVFRAQTSHKMPRVQAALLDVFRRKAHEFDFLEREGNLPRYEVRIRFEK